MGYKSRQIRSRYYKHFRGYELIISFVTVGVLVAIFSGLGFSYVDSKLAEIYKPLYAVIAPIAGSLLGFVITGISILLAFGDTGRLVYLKKSPHYKEVYRVYLSTIKYLGILTIVSITALIFNSTIFWRIPLFCIILWGVIISGLRLYRCFWVLHHIVKLAGMETIE